MSAKLCILSCQNFHEEVAAAIAAEGWPDVVAAIFPARCGHPPLGWEELQTLLPAGCTQVVVLGSACLPQMGEPPAGFPPLRLLRQEQCFNMVANPRLVGEAIASGSYLLTPGWLADWRGRLADMGFTPETSSEFFEDFARHLVLLDTGLDASAQGRLKDFASATGLPSTRIAVGLDHLRMLLVKVVLEWRLEHEQRKGQERERDHARKTADHVLALDLLARLGNARTEAEVIAGIEELFQMLFSPAILHYVRVEDGQIVTDPNISAELMAELRRLQSPHAWTSSGQGFLLRITHADSLLGLIVVDGVALPEHRERYLNMALAMKGVCALAIEDARVKFELERHRNQLEELVHLRTAELSRSRDAAEAASRAKSAFLANMSHELRTPLNAILGLGHIVGAKLDDPGLRAQVKTITRSGRQLLELVNLVLEISALEADEFQLEAADFFLPALLEEALGASRERADPKGLALAQEIDPALAHWLRGDAARLGRMLAILTGNAVKFSEHGRVTLRARLVDSVVDSVVDSLVDSNGDELRVRFEVEDQGIGIGAQQQAALFNTFEQADNSTTRRHGGLGLSLALCKRLTERMGGEIGLSSTLGQGSTFWIAVPLRRALDTVQVETRPVTEPTQELPAVSAAVLTPAQTPPADPATVHAVLKQLDALLALNDTAATALFEQYASELRAAMGAPGEQLGRQIARFEFEAARKTLRTRRK